MAEDFAPFDVDVTTEPPVLAALTRASAYDTVFGMTVRRRQAVTLLLTLLRIMMPVDDWVPGPARELRVAEQTRITPTALAGVRHITRTYYLGGCAGPHHFVRGLVR